MRISEQGGVSSKPAAPAKRAPSPAQQVRSGVIDLFKTATRGEHETTAGEVQGQGPYPGVPGYSTLDNWTRSQATGTYTAPDYAIQLLEKAGYAQPTTKGTGRQTIPGLNMNAADDLTPYGYSVTDEEARNILETYAPDAKGDPAKIAAERVESGGRAVPMTMAAYRKLTPDQKAAVDFNTALIEAREKDLNAGWMLQVPPAHAAVDARSKSLFGDDVTTGGNPEHVLKLLEKIGYKAPGTRLEDFMSLDMAISADELKDLKLPKDIQFATPSPEVKKSQEGPADPFTGEKAPSPFDQVPVNDYSKVRSAENLGMLQLEVIRRAGEALTKARATGLNGRGMAALDGKAPLGWGSSVSVFDSPEDKAKNSDFQLILERLQNDTSKTKLADSKAFWAGLKTAGATEKDIDQLFEFLDQRTRWMIDNDMKPLEGQNDATIIRELAGLGPANG